MFSFKNINKLAFYCLMLACAGCVSANNNIASYGNEERPTRTVKAETSITEDEDIITTASVDKQVVENSNAISKQEDLPEIEAEPKVVNAPELQTNEFEKNVEKSDEPEIQQVAQLPGIYVQIVNAALTKDSFSEEATLRSREHALAAHQQGLLPQVRPGASVNSEGDTVLSVNVEQILYDSGHYVAGKKVLEGQQSAANANFRIEQNERSTKAIAAYIEYHRLTAIQKTSKEIVSIFKRYERQSRQRIDNGIGDSSESDLFQVKKLQAETDFERLESERFAVEQEYKSLTGNPVIQKTPVRLGVINKIDNSPSLALAKAERDEARGNLELDVANRKPRISLVGNVGSASDTFDEEDMDIRVAVSVNQPLNWGFNHALASSQSTLEAGNIKYDKTLRDNRDKVKKLLLELRRAEGSKKRLRKLSKSANSRVNRFNEQFLAGKSSINEAASIIDSYKQIKNNLTETEYRIFAIELEIASISGLI